MTSSMLRSISLLSLSITLAATGCNYRTGSDDDDDLGIPEQGKVTTPAPGGGGGQTPGSPSTKPGPGAPSLPGESFVLPSWMREDVQPKSGRFAQTYGLDHYAGKTIAVVLLEGYCPYCRSNSVVAQELQDKLDDEGLDVQIVILGDAAASELAAKVSLPTFKDSAGEAWEEMRKGAKKHDTFVFGPNGERTYFWLGSYTGDPARWTTEVGAEIRKVAKPRS